MDPYEWDNDKNDANQRKHGFGFEVIYEFDWVEAVVQLDDRHDYGEKRFRAFGRIAGAPYCVAFTPRNGRTRLIMMRRMHEKEARRYGL